MNSDVLSEIIEESLNDNVDEAEVFTGQSTVPTEDTEDIKTTEDIKSTEDIESIEDTKEIEYTENTENTSEVITGTFTMEQAARELGITPASLRTFLNELGEDTIQISRTLGGHRRLTYENIEQIERYYAIMRNNGMSVKQLKEVLNTKEGKILEKPNELEQLAELLTLFRSQTREDLQEMAKIMAKEVLDSNKLLLESNDNKGLKEDIQQEVSAEISQFSEEIGSKINELSSLINKLAEDNKKKDAQIEALKEQNQKIIENTTKKKRWPFS